ncbi:hypothetical protein PAXRUDRAFT_276762 [Paxillus rubicundulus Ve08.2h10]|uniref:Major facilitator superfamily (MFS) profile domain-containing protein n=1 Tax=Paxillus rubicundulus Ve08.2h10 TaxID=930991 RepID=A0A0D0DMA0_9AGAM|nr:hypothetical protein PAXRUDRAFT_276762 [Paxillus rubicundulus Ve08.2h10]
MFRWVISIRFLPPLPDRVAMSLPATIGDAQIAAEEAFIALNPTLTRCASPRRPPSKLEYSEAFDLVSVAPVVGAEHHGSTGCDVQFVPRTNPKTQKFREQMQFVALCWFIYLEGWNDGSNGPLLPRIQEVYGVGYAMVSLIFVFACLGFITGALSNVVLSERLGFGKVMVLGV